MRTIAFSKTKVGHAGGPALMEIDTSGNGFQFVPGLNLLVAPNGYGKSSLLQTLAGVIPPLEGGIFFGNRRLQAETDVLYISEYIAFPKFIYPHEWIQFATGEKNPHPGHLQKWQEKFSLQGTRKRFLGRMSQGERRKITWLAAWFSEKPVLLMDEPFDGLDLFSVEAAKGMLSDWKARGRIICMVSHQVDHLFGRIDQLVLIQNKWICSGDNIVKAAKDGQALTRGILEFYQSKRG